MSFVTKLQRINAYIGKTISWLSLFMVLITFLIVVMRYGFNTGSIAMQESVMYLYATSFLLGISYTYQSDQHVRVDIFYNKMSAKGQAWINILGILFLLLPMMGFILYSCWDYVFSAWKIMEESGDAGGLAYVYLLKTTMVIMPFLVLMEGFSQLLINVQKIRTQP